MWDGKANIGWMNTKNDLNIRGWVRNDKHLAYTRDANKDIFCENYLYSNV